MPAGYLLKVSQICEVVGALLLEVKIFADFNCIFLTRFVMTLNNCKKNDSLDIPQGVTRFPH